MHLHGCEIVSFVVLMECSVLPSVLFCLFVLRVRFLIIIMMMICSMSGGSSAYTIQSLTQIDIVSFTKLASFALYSHVYYNIEILIKLLMIFIRRLQTFFTSMLQHSTYESAIIYDMVPTP